MDGDALELELSKFWAEGFMVLRRAVPAIVAEQARLDVACIDAGEFERVCQDENHLQVPLSLGTPAFKELMTAGKKMVKQFHMRWAPQQWFAMKTEAGSAEQLPHYAFHLPDIADTRTRYEMTMQAVLLVGLAPQTRVTVFSRCFAVANPAKRFTIRFGPGDCVIVRGDLVHAAGASDITSYHARCGLAVKGVPAEAVVAHTIRASDITRKCRYCEFMSTGSRRVLNHEQRCPANPRRDLIKRRKRELDLRGQKCSYCDQRFQLRDTCRKHMKRKHKKELDEDV